MSLEQRTSLAIVIVSYNTREMTLECLRSLFDQTNDVDMDVIVFDNDSKDGSADAIASEFGERLRLVRSPDNLGFARANNEAAKMTQAEYLLLLNPDTIVLDRAVDRLVDFAVQSPRYGIYGGRTVFADRSLNIASCWGQMTLWSLFCKATGLSALFPRTNLFDPESLGSWKRDTVREVDIVVGCFLLLKRRLWEELGGFNLKYWMYGEEADLCLRAKKLGYQPIITPDAQIVHYVGAATQLVERKAIMVSKAKATLVRDHWHPATAPVGIGLLWAWSASRRLGSMMLHKVVGKRFEKSASGWSHVWQQRSDWLAGYKSNTTAT